MELCSYGVNYVRLSDDFLTAGIVIRDYPITTPARKKMLRAARPNIIELADIERVAQLTGQVTDDLNAELRTRMDAIIEQYRQSKSYQTEVVELLRPDLQKTLGQVHDYKQFVQQIIQNLAVHLQLQFPGVALEEALDQAPHELTSIYWAATLMDERLDAALFLEYPDRIREPREERLVRLHGMALKYVRIYQNRASRKRLHVHVAGESWAQTSCNPRALGIVPHTLIDNAIKYAPEGSKVVVAVEESADRVALSVESYGPRIEPEEQSRIFDLFYRGQAAEEQSAEGTGFGLASAQNVARMHDAEIVVEQAEQPRADGAYPTTFSVSFAIDRAGSDSRGDDSSGVRRSRGRR